jgi:GT2 family glycosyltransferase
MGTGVQQETAAYQYETLQRQAAQSGDYTGVIAWLAARRDRDALQRLAPELPETNRWLAALFLGGDPAALAENLPQDTPDWIRYTLAKALLRSGNIDAVLALFENSLAHGGSGTAVINPLIRFLAQAGASELAGDLAAVSLQLSPDQADIAALEKTLVNGEAPSLPLLYLDILPKHLPVSFYIPACNVEAFIAQAIEGLFRMHYPIEEVLVIDDGSADRSIEIARQYPVRILAHPENRGLAAARNTAFENLAAALIGALDTDAVPAPDYMNAILMELENAPPACAGAGGRLLEAHTETPADAWRMLHMPQDAGPRRIHPPDFLHGANTVFYRGAVRAAGGYDPQYRTNHEDRDMGRRLRKAGYTFTHVPGAVCRHYRRDTAGSVLRGIWNWSFHTRREGGIFDTAESLFRELPFLFRESVKMMEEDSRAGYEKVLYIDFLYAFHTAFRNLRHGADTGLFSPAAARGTQDRLIAALCRADEPRGGLLYKRVCRDMTPLFCEAAPSTVAAAAAESLDAAEAALQALYGNLPEERYQHLTAQMETP